MVWELITLRPIELRIPILVNCLYRPLINIIMQQLADFGNARDQQKQIKSSLKGTQRVDQSSEAADLKSRLPLNLQRAVDLASEKGASSSVIALPLLFHGLVLLHTKECFVSLSVSVTIGPLPICQPSVLVDLISPLSMLDM